MKNNLVQLALNPVWVLENLISGTRTVTKNCQKLHYHKIFSYFTFYSKFEKASIISFPITLLIIHTIKFSSFYIPGFERVDWRALIWRFNRAPGTGIGSGSVSPKIQSQGLKIISSKPIDSNHPRKVEELEMVWVPIITDYYWYYYWSINQILETSIRFHDRNMKSHNFGKFGVMKLNYRVIFIISIHISKNIRRDITVVFIFIC